MRIEHLLKMKDFPNEIKEFPKEINISIIKEFYIHMNIKIKEFPIKMK